MKVILYFHFWKLSGKIQCLPLQNWDKIPNGFYHEKGLTYL